MMTIQVFMSNSDNARLTEEIKDVVCRYCNFDYTALVIRFIISDWTFQSIEIH